MSNLYIAVYRRALDSGWPYDLGDDPAFQASENPGRRITWGVCRPNVRNAIRADDVVVFLSTGRRTPCQYQFVGFATVETKIRRDVIWLRKELSPYRDYQNLLIKRVGNGFKHVEPPHLGMKVWHKDWLSRIVMPNDRGNTDFLALQSQHFLPDGARILGRRVSFAENYVVFQPEGVGSFVALNPPTVAEAGMNGTCEVWRKDHFSKQLRELLFTGAARSYVRTRHKQLAHPHIRVPDINAAYLRRELLALCARCSVGSRVEAHTTIDRVQRLRMMFSPGESKAQRSC
jgi:hypothetical protein